MSTPRSQRGDDANTAFGPPAKPRQRKAGYVREAAAQDVRAGEHRRRPSEDTSIPHESLASRIASRRQEGQGS